MRDWIDNASYRDLLYKNRFEPVGSPWFSGEMGKYFSVRMGELRSKTSHKDKVAASKRIGWGNRDN